jgi:hypothetical protein
VGASKRKRGGDSGRGLRKGVRARVWRERGGVWVRSERGRVRGREGGREGGRERGREVMRRRFCGGRIALALAQFVRIRD